MSILSFKKVEVRRARLWVVRQEVAQSCQHSRCFVWPRWTGLHMTHDAHRVCNRKGVMKFPFGACVILAYCDLALHSPSSSPLFPSRSHFCRHPTHFVRIHSFAHSHPLTHSPITLTHSLTHPLTLTQSITLTHADSPSYTPRRPVFG